jgi:hypothetical protein
MPELRPEVMSEVGSEERTEPFSQSELDARIRGTRVEPSNSHQTHERAVSLDGLLVGDDQYEKGVRILVRPLTKLASYRSVSPGNDNCRLLALKAEVASAEEPEHKVLAVTQTSRDIKFSVRIPKDTQDDQVRPPLWCELYYDPASDKVIFVNRSDVPLTLDRVSQDPTANESHFLTPSMIRGLRPGTWRITVGQVAVLDFRILERRPVTVHKSRSALAEAEQPVSTTSDQMNPSSKRSLDANDGERRVKRRISDSQAEADDNVVMFLRPSANPLVFPLPGSRDTNRHLSVANVDGSIQVEKGDTVTIPGVCELDEYKLTSRDHIASTALSQVYTATHSHVPDNIVTVKVLKTTKRPHDTRPYERDVIGQAEMWMRESQTQEGLEHDSIVRYYGGDARYLSLYMEHVDAQDLSTSKRWRSRENDEFMGSREDARRILHDISGALNYIHGRNMIHNDIKPANILYSPDRGAVLCDFGLSTAISTTRSGGGTPYYVPPEYIGKGQRGPPSDVWALGVTTLYTLRKICLPDSRGREHHPKRLYWQIADINRPPHRQVGDAQPAIDQMREWLSEIYEARARLSNHDRLERLVKSMLTPNPAQRITMLEVMQELERI